MWILFVPHSVVRIPRTCSVPVEAVVGVVQTETVALAVGVADRRDLEVPVAVEPVAVARTYLEELVVEESAALVVAEVAGRTETVVLAVVGVAVGQGIRRETVSQSAAVGSVAVVVQTCLDSVAVAAVARTCLDSVVVVVAAEVDRDYRLL